MIPKFWLLDACAYNFCRYPLKTLPCLLSTCAYNAFVICGHHIYKTMKAVKFFRNYEDSHAVSMYSCVARPYVPAAYRLFQL